MDLTAISKNVTGNFIEYGTGLVFELPAGYVGLIFPRSSISKTNLAQANSVGVLDSGYRGELKIRFFKKNQKGEEYNIGDKIGQIIIIPIPSVELIESEKLSDTERGDGGFGSTGR